MKHLLTHALAATAIAALTACGSGGGGSSVSSLTGTAAVGAPLPNATVTLKDANGKTLTTTADANGAYTFSDVSGLTAPLMVQATGTAGGTTYTLHSLLEKVPAAGVSGVINVTPATEAATAQAVGTSPATVFADATKIKAVDTTKLADAKARLNAALKEVLTALGQDPTKVDLFTTKFTADNTGLDKLLDLVQVSNSTNTSTNGQDLKITDKNTQVTKTVDTNTAAKDVPPLPKPDDSTVKLDTSGIKVSLAAFNKLSGSTADIQSSDMKDLFDVDFLNQGKNRDDQIADIAANAVGITFTDYVLNGCDGKTNVCQGHATAKFKDGTTEKFTLPMKQGSDGKWRAYGEQAPFKFELKAVVQQQNYVGTNAPSPSLLTGFNFYFTGTKGNSSTRVYKSAQFYTSLDNGATWTLSASLKENASCTGSWLPLAPTATTVPGCSNFVTVSDSAIIATRNEAQAKGEKWSKIVAYTNADFTGTSVVYKYRSTQQLFTAETAIAAIKARNLNITTTELGTNSVSFTGKPNSVSIRVYNTTNYGSTTWDGPTEVATLNEKATTAAALTLCGAGPNCSATYGTGAMIGQINLSGYDPQGRGVWVQWSGGAGAGSTVGIANTSSSAPIAATN